MLQDDHEIPPFHPFLDRLKWLRRTCGLSEAEIDRRAGMPVGSFNRYASRGANRIKDLGRTEFAR